MPGEMVDLRVGTSGFDYPDWKGILYPEGLPRQNFLEVYSRTFQTLEINFTYYRQPSYSTLLSMTDKANPSMDFSIKAHKTLTHEIDLTSFKSEAKTFLDGIKPVAEHDRLASILLEFPYSFHYEPERRRYLASLLDELVSFPLVVEFRHRDWFNERVYEELIKRNISLCMMDMPENAMPGGIKEMVTSDLAYLRLHGRNSDNWWTGTNVSRYDYLYSGDEIRAWAGKLTDIKDAAKKIRVYFNNHARGNAVKNALEMKAIIDEGTT